MKKRNLLKALMDMGWGPKEFVELLEELKTQMEELPEVCEQKKKEEQEKTIEKLLKEVGVPLNVMGFEYLKYSVIFCLDKGKRPLLEEVYEDVSLKCDSTPSRVARAVRHAVSRCFDVPNAKLREVVGEVIYVEGHATNREFLWSLVLYLNS